MKKNDPTIDRYLSIFKLDIHQAIKVLHEDSLSSSIYKLILKDKTNFILKIPFDNNRWKREKFFLNEVKDHIPVPKIIDTVDPTIDLPGAILMEYLDGEIISIKNYSNKISFQMGKMLGDLHNIPTKFYGDVAKELHDPTLLNGKLILKNYFEESFNECKDILDKTLLNKISIYFYEALYEIKYLDGPSIVHTDYKPGNIIYKADQIIGLIDWENAKYSFREEDFLRMEFLVWDSNPQYKKDFFEGYSTVRKLPNLDSIMPILKIAKALGAIGFTIERKTYKNEHKFIFDLNLQYLESFFHTKE